MLTHCYSAREIQAQEGLSPQIWAPNSSGSSTPLREPIPESPNNANFPDFELPPVENNITGKASIRRSRAGTLPSNFNSTGTINGLGSPGSLHLNTFRPAPSSTSFRSGSANSSKAVYGNNESTATKSALLSRLRAGSMPQRANFISSVPSPFGPSIFSSGWNSGSERLSTLQSIQSSNGRSSPARSSFSKDSLADSDVKTLDYLGLVDNSQAGRPTLGPSDIELLLEGQRVQNALRTPHAPGDKNANRFRSYSVNAKEKYEDEDDEFNQPSSYAGPHSGSLTPTSDATAAAYAVHEAVRRHNLEVQAFANFASASRPRARTAGVLDSPSSRILRNYIPASSKLDGEVRASDIQASEHSDYEGLTEAVQGMKVNGMNRQDFTSEDGTNEEPTRALWLGNIPSSTTVSSLHAIFGNFGQIDSLRILTHKNCGFVNYEKVESAVCARSQLNNKEVFPGAGPVRIGFAKVPSTSATSAANTGVSSPSPEQVTRHNLDLGFHDTPQIAESSSATNNSIPEPPRLAEIGTRIPSIVRELGASEEEQSRIASIVDKAILFDSYKSEIPPVPEPSPNRAHDAPRLREIRKRIDNNSCTQTEMEEIAIGMLPEIAELSSDYLGNTVVQKLFTFCSENVKEAMLNEIAPHMAEIGVHKNGTWAAQKVIDVAKTPTSMRRITDNLRPYTVALFLDQFGNYVIQGCLRYQFPLNNFIFETIVARLWNLAQGRFGARAIRACLESHYATKDQQRAVAACIALHGVQLATNTNGALLLTWFLDTCTFPRRRTTLAPHLIPHLVQLCTHKVAYLTVLKIINQRNEAEARDAILNALFFSADDKVLEQILSDQTYGATLIFKILTTPFLDDSIRSDVMQNVRAVLSKLKAQPVQGYKRLMDEVGMSVCSSGLAGRDAPDGPRSINPKHISPRGPHMHGGQGGGANRQFHQSDIHQASYDHQFQQQPAFSSSQPKPGDSNAMKQFPVTSGLNAPTFAPSASLTNILTPQQHQQQYFQYQQHQPHQQTAMIGRAPSYHSSVGIPTTYGPSPGAVPSPVQASANTFSSAAMYGASPMMGGVYGYQVPFTTAAHPRHRMQHSQNQQSSQSYPKAQPASGDIGQ